MQAIESNTEHNVQLLADQHDVRPARTVPGASALSLKERAQAASKASYCSRYAEHRAHGHATTARAASHTVRQAEIAFCSSLSPSHIPYSLLTTTHLQRWSTEASPPPPAPRPHPGTSGTAAQALPCMLQNCALAGPTRATSCGASGAYPPEKHWNASCAQARCRVPDLRTHIMYARAICIERSTATPEA